MPAILRPSRPLLVRAINNHEIHIPDNTAVGAYTLGCFFGAVATIWLGNILGRKKTIFIGSCIMIVGAAIQTASFSLAQLIVGRWITGFGNGTILLNDKCLLLC